MMKWKGVCRLALGLVVACVLTAIPQGRQAEPWWAALPRPIYATLERLAVDTDWFEVYRIAPGIAAIYEPGHWEETVSYLIEGEDRAILFDSAFGIGDIKHVVDQLTALDVLVVNSHTHPDHVGGNRQFEAFAIFDSNFGRQRLAAGRRDLSGLITDESVWMDLPAGFDRVAYRLTPMRASRYLADGEILDLGGRQLEVLHTPGHTPGSICLLDRANRVLFTGDTFYPSSLYAHLPDADFDDYHQSAQRLGALESDVDIVCSGHNEAKVDATVLGRMARAFETIRSGTVAGAREGDGLLRYAFDGFAVLTRADR